MKTKITLMLAIVSSMTLMEAGFGSLCSPVSSETGEPGGAHHKEPMNLASNVEFQRIVQTQTTLIHHHHKHRHKNVQRHRVQQKK